MFGNRGFVDSPVHFCGCWYPMLASHGYVQRQYLPQVELSTSTTILSTTSRTVLRQTFVNSNSGPLSEVRYTFPLYDGVSVVGFRCAVGTKTIVGIVKEKQHARAEYQEAVERGETAGLLEQLPEASDVFTTSIGNVPAHEKVRVEIVYLGELKHDAETDGSRFTIPTIIAPRYGGTSLDSAHKIAETTVSDQGGIQISVDVILDEGSVIRGLQSPSHPIAVTMGRTATMHEDAFATNHASATLTLGSTELDKDFVLVLLAKGNDTPRALLETHPSIPNQRALMTTLVPKFNIPNSSPEIVFVVDRSGSMEGKIDTLVAAMKVFLKSLPIGVKFNICSFGSRHTFLFKKSKTYDQSSLEEALQHLKSFKANYGGTQMLGPIEATVKNRYADLSLEVMVLTDGQIWNQDELFAFINEQTNARFFSLGIGHGASSALVEGIARAGHGFAQFVGENEKMDKRVVRMLKGALTPHVDDYTLEVKYRDDQMDATCGDDDGFEVVESFRDSTTLDLVPDLDEPKEKKKTTISLFDTSAQEEPTNPPTGRYDNLPKIPVPKVLQAPHKIPALFPFNRTNVYLLLGPDACRHQPESVILRGTSEHGPLELQIPVQDVGVGETIHQLAAKKAVHELEQGRGWITEAKTATGRLLKNQYEGKWDLIVEREAVRLGVEFQVGGKWCSFVAVEQKGETSSRPLTELQTSGDDLEKDSSRWKSTNSKSPVVHTHTHINAFGFGASPASHSIFRRDRSLSGNATSGPSAAPAAFFGGSHPRRLPAKRLFEATSRFASPNSGTLDPISHANASPATSFNTSPISNESTCRSLPFSQRAASGGLIQPAASDGSVNFRPPSRPSPGSSTGADVPDQIQTDLAFGVHEEETTNSTSNDTVSQADSSGDITGDGLFSLGTPYGGAGAALSRNTPAPPPYFSGALRPGTQPPSGLFTRHSSQMPSASLSKEPLSSPALAPVPIIMSRAGRGEALTSLPHSAEMTIGGRMPDKLKKSRNLGAGIRDLASGFSFALSSPMRARKVERDISKPIIQKSSEVNSDGDADEEMEDVASSSQESPLNQDATSLDAEQKMHQLIEMQHFDGSWCSDSNSKNNKLWTLLGVTRDQVAAMTLTLTLNDNTVRDKVKATALAIAWLETKASHDAEVWEMVVAKAKAWLATQVGGSEHAVDEALTMARDLLIGMPS